MTIDLLAAFLLSYQVDQTTETTGMAAAHKYFLRTRFTWKDFEEMTKQLNLPLIAKVRPDVNYFLTLLIFT